MKAKILFFDFTEQIRRAPKALLSNVNDFLLALIKRSHMVLESLLILESRLRRRSLQY